MDDMQRIQITVGAMIAAGEPFEDETLGQWQERILANARTIWLLSGADGPVGAWLEMMARTRSYPATVMSVDKEARTGRGLVKLRVRPSKYNKEGIEVTRTDHLHPYQSTDDGPGMPVYRSLRRLVGHKVSVWAETEKDEDGAIRGKVIRYVEDRGVVGDDED